MALFNCAQLLASSGRRVLMIDMDLEAPGLSYLIRNHRSPVSVGEEQEEEKGFLDLAYEFVNDPKHWPLGGNDAASRMNRYLVELRIPEALGSETNRGALFLLPAGRLDQQYGGRLGLWRRPPMDQLQERWADHLRNVIQSMGRFDYVLIDARTGYSDEAYLAVRVLSDHLVVLSGLNNQNIIGTAGFLKQLRYWDIKDGATERKTILVASPVPIWEDDAKARRWKIIDNLFKEHLGEIIRFTHRLPYHPRLALEEMALVAELGDSTLARSYRELADILRMLAKDSVEYWEERVEGALGRLGSDDWGLWLNDLTKALKELKRLNKDRFDHLLHVSLDQVVSLPKVSVVSEFFDSMSQLAPEDQDVAAARARWLARTEQPEAYDALRKIRDQAKMKGAFQIEMEALMEESLLKETRGKIDPAVESAENALDAARKSNDKENIASLLLRIGRLYLETGRYDIAERNLIEGISKNLALDHRRGAATAYYQLAHIKQFHGAYSEARKLLSSAENILENLKDSQALGATLHAIAGIDRLQGLYDKARESYDASLSISKEFDDRRWIGTNLFAKGELERLQGNYELACELFHESWILNKYTKEAREIVIRKVYLEATMCLKDPQLSMDGLTRAITELKKLGDSYRLLRAANLRIECHMARKRFTLAAKLARKVINEADERTYCGIAADARCLVSDSEAILENWEDAKAEAGKALAFFKKAEVQDHPFMERMNAILLHSSLQQVADNDIN